MRENPRVVILIGMFSIISVIGWELWQDLSVSPVDISYIRTRLVGYLLLMSPLVVFVVLVPIMKLIKHLRTKLDKKLR